MGKIINTLIILALSTFLSSIHAECQLAKLYNTISDDVEFSLIVGNYDSRYLGSCRQSARNIPNVPQYNEKLDSLRIWAKAETNIRQQFAQISKLVSDDFTRYGLGSLEETQAFLSGMNETLNNSYLHTHQAVASLKRGASALKEAIDQATLERQQYQKSYDQLNSKRPRPESAELKA